MTKEEVLEGLNQFSGTENYYRHGKYTLLTDGVKWLCDSAGAYWIMDIISSVLTTKPLVRKEEFLVAVVQVSPDNEGNKTCTFELQDGDYKVLYHQDIVYTDLVLDELKLYVEPSWTNGIVDEKVILLPSEH